MRREDTKDEAAFRAEVRAWLEANAELRTDAPAAPLDHSPEAEARAWEAMKVWQRKKFEGGWAAITWPVEYGGRGGTPGTRPPTGSPRAGPGRTLASW